MEDFCALPGGVLASSNERGNDAAACLDGMNATFSASTAETPKARGRMLARAPDLNGARDIGETSTARGTLSPADILRPSDKPVLQRWKTILRILMGHGTGAPKQISIIMVRPLRERKGPTMFLALPSSFQLAAWTCRPCTTKQCAFASATPENTGLLQLVVVLRTLLQDRMAALNGRTVKHVLNQDLGAFMRLIGLSTFQVPLRTGHV